MFLSGSPLIAKVLKQFSMSPDPHPLRAESENNWPIFEIQFFEKLQTFQKAFIFSKKKHRKILHGGATELRVPHLNLSVSLPLRVCVFKHISSEFEKKRNFPTKNFVNMTRDQKK